MATYYIDADSGDNANDGSSGSPWETHTYAYNQISAGDTIIAKTATASYTFEDDTLDKAYTLEGEEVPSFDPVTQTWSGAIFDGGDIGAVQWTIISQSTINNIIFTKFQSSTWYGSFNINSTVTINRCIFFDIDMDGGRGYQSGLFYLEDNSQLDMTACVVYDLTNIAGTPCVFGGWRIENSTYNISSCAFSDAALGDIVSCRTVTNVTYSSINSIYYQSSANSSFDGNQPNNYDFTYNCAYNFSDEPSGTGNITSDPKFVDPTNGDFRLQSDSGCIGQGGVA